MHIAFIVDPLTTLKPGKDSSLEMMRAAQQRGHRVAIIEPGGLALHQGQVMAVYQRLVLQDTDARNDWYQVEPPGTCPLTAFDAVMMRKDPPFDMEYVVSTYLLEIAESNGVKVFNRARSLRDFNEKLATARFPDLTPALLVSRRYAPLLDFIREQQDVILKPLDGMGGSEIFRVHERDPNLSVILETLTRHEQRTIMAQRYLPAIAQGDKRVLLVDGEPMPWCLARLPAPGETRGNLAAGGTGRAQPLSASDLEIAHRVGPVLRQAGLLLVGLDIIGEHLTEINVTSPTCMREIRDQSGLDIAEKVILAVERHVGLPTA